MEMEFPFTTSQKIKMIKEPNALKNVLEVSTLLDYL
jgi:hypothetical protein